MRYFAIKAREGDFLSGLYTNIVATLMCGPRERVVEVEITEITDGSTPNYYGWKDKGAVEVHHIYKAPFLVEMCFPYAIENYVDRGAIVPLRVVIVENAK